MNPVVRSVAVGVTAALALNGGAAAVDAQPGTQGVRTQNPCAAKNPCAARNPCAAKNPCGAKNPCAAAAKVDPRMVTRPAGTKLMLAGRPDLVAEGARLWKDTKLSTNGLSCFTCHQNNASFKPTFAKPYPHPVEMPKDRAGLRQVNIDEMVQLCMLIPMAAKPLPWDSQELAALSAYSLQVQKTFKPAAARPAAANPCAAKSSASSRRSRGSWAHRAARARSTMALKIGSSSTPIAWTSGCRYGAKTAEGGR